MKSDARANAPPQLLKPVACLSVLWASEQLTLPSAFIQSKNLKRLGRLNGLSDDPARRALVVLSGHLCEAI
jgi:hypothetical protein